MARYRGSARWAANKFGKAVARNYVRNSRRNKNYGSGPGCSTFFIILFLVFIVVSIAR